ncbi:MAG: alpha/beta hydrolase [Myxococcota bacterium]|nr:alpha/beta hydrolase [Myxococcota bacterium]
MRPTSRRISGADDVALNLLDWGGGGGDRPPLLFVHGYGHNARLWDPLVPDLADHYRVLALDSRGHGDSEPDPEYRYHNAAIGRDVEAVVDQLKLERVALVGHSQGGHACLRFAGRHPERTSRLVLADAGPDIPSGGTGAPPASLRLLAPSFESVAAYAAILGELYPLLDAAARASLAEHSLRPTDDGRHAPRLDARFLRRESKRDAESRVSFDRQAWAAKENARIWHYLERITCPTLVVRGEHSPLLSAETVRRMVDDVLADSRAVEIPDAGHALMLDNPAAFRAALLAFLCAQGSIRE